MVRQTDDAWHQVDQLFTQYLELPGDQRPGFLDELQSSDPEAYRALMRLIEEMSASEGFMERPESWFARADDPGDCEGRSMEGERMGSYRLGRKLGSGGMGAVYLASRADGAFEKEVAIKVLRVEKGGNALREQIERERSLLARMEHPHITRLLDGGITPDDQPYLVMEYVDGVPIDQFCRIHDLGVHDAIALFTQVCDAMAFSHRNLIVHRDIKPGNTLVTQSGQVKVLDFGIARLINPDTGNPSPPTLTLMRALTPAYASPEQLRGEPVSTASDIYSLGVMLYQLLTRQLPGECTDTPFEQMRRRVEDHEPLRPSENLSPSMRHHRRTLRGDLDLIVMKAMRPDPRERYRSVDHFREDLERYLAGLPIDARPRSAWYLLRKTLRRHRLVTALTVTLILSLTGSLIATTRQSRHIAQEREKAVQVTGFLKDLFHMAEPSQNLGNAVTLLDALNFGVDRLNRDLETQPAVRAELLNTLGGLYTDLGQLEQARQILEKAMDLRKHIHGTDSRAWAETALNLGLLNLHASRFDEAERLLTQAYAVFLEQLGPHHWQTLTARHQVGLMHRFKGDLLQAERVLREVVEQSDSASELRQTAERVLASTLIDLRQFEEAQKRLAHLIDQAERRGDILARHQATEELASLFREMNQPQRAEPLLRGLLHTMEAIYGSQHIIPCGIRRSLALVLAQQQRFDEAQAQLDHAITFAQKKLPTQHKFTALILNATGSVALARGNLHSASQHFQEALDMNRALHSGDHADLAVNLHNLADALQQTGDFTRAESLHRASLDMSERLLGPEHAARLVSPTALAYLYFFSGRPRQALPLFENASQQLGRMMGSDHPDTLNALQGLAWARFELGHVDQAEQQFHDVLTRRIQNLGQNHPDVATTLHSLAWVEFTKGKTEAAASRLQQAIDIRTSVFGERHPDLAWSLNNLGLVYQRQHKLHEAKEVLIQARDMRRELLGPTHPLFLQSLNNVGQLLMQMEQWEEAEVVFSELVELATKVFGLHSRELAVLCSRQAIVLDHLNQPHRAQALLQQAWEISSTNGYGRERLTALEHIGQRLVEQSKFEQAVQWLKSDMEAHEDDWPSSLQQLYLQALSLNGQCNEARHHFLRLQSQANRSLSQEDIHALGQFLGDSCPP